MDSNINKLKITELIDKLEEIKKGDIDKECILKMTTISNILREKCKRNNECETVEAKDIVLDLLATAKFGQVLAKCLNTEFFEQAYNSCVFHEKFFKSFHSLQSNKLLNIARDIIKESQQFAAISLDATPKIVNRQRSQPMKQTEKITTMKETAHKQDEGENFNDIVRNIFKVLNHVYQKEKVPLDYYRFVTDTSSFSNTVENVFYTSFLCEQKKALLFEENEVLKIQPCAKKSERDNETTMITVNMEMWENFNYEMGYIQQYQNL